MEKIIMVKFEIVSLLIKSDGRPDPASRQFDGIMYPTEEEFAILDEAIKKVKKSFVKVVL